MDFEKAVQGMIQKKKINEASEALESHIDIKPIVEKAENFEIACEQDAKQALSMSLQARKLKKALEEKRSEIVRPHIDFQRAVNSFAKEYTATLEKIEERLKGKLEVWLEAQKTFQPNFCELMIEVEDGKLTQKEELDFCIEEFDKIPSNYLKVDEKKIKEAIKMGMRNIPGIKIFQKKTLSMRINNG